MLLKLPDFFYQQRCVNLSVLATTDIDDLLSLLKRY